MSNENSMMDKLFEELNQIVKGKIRRNYDISHFTWFKVGGEAEIFFQPADTEDLQNILKIFAGWSHKLDEENQAINIIGAGSNIIVRDKGLAGLTIKLGRGFTDCHIKGDVVEVFASCLNVNLAKFVAANNIGGLEFLVGIPGTIGGGIAMNAGAYGSEFKDVIIDFQAIDYLGNLHNFTNEQVEWGYRHNPLTNKMIFTKVRLRGKNCDKSIVNQKMQEIVQARNSTQPVSAKTGGSTFANPDNGKAWKLIDQVGLRGFEVGGAQFSPLHCNFMLNNGTATAADLEALGELAKNKVAQHTGVNLRWEIKRLGRL